MVLFTTALFSQVDSTKVVTDTIKVDTINHVESVKIDTVKVDSINTLDVSAIEYPIISVDSLGNKLVIFTISQAIKIDNKLDILELLKERELISVESDSISLRVINDKNLVIAEQGMKISKLEESNQNKQSQIDNLKSQIATYLLSESTYKEELSNKDMEIDLHLGKIKDLKRKNLIGGITGGVVITTLAAILLTRK